jgi:hypothetical protein
VSAAALAGIGVVELFWGPVRGGATLAFPRRAGRDRPRNYWPVLAFSAKMVFFSRQAAQ